jgi:Cu+-exporting ATPase
MAGWRFNVVAGLIATLPLMAGEWIFPWGTVRWFHWLAFALALPVQVFCGARFYRGAWTQLKAGSSNMDTLVALGSTAAFAYSVWGLLAGGARHLYFMESAAIITLISIGHWLESLASARATSALQTLLSLTPPNARRLAADGTAADVPMASLRIGDLVLLKPGDRVPADGQVIEGASGVDESMLTGESLPADKALGAALYAGTLNQNGQLIMRVSATGQTTALAYIIAAVRRAQSSRANIQRIGDRVSSIFVPIVVVLALGTALWWGLAPESARLTHQWLGQFLWQVHRPESAWAGAIIYAAGVLIVACPCAMGLATPVAIMAGTNVATRRGILIRDGVALEKTGRLTAVVFDKTGTLTQGQVAVTAVENYSRVAPGSVGPSQLDVRSLAAALARPSNHPLSQAVSKLADAPIPITDWQEMRGAGVQGLLQLAGTEAAYTNVRLGSLNWLRDTGVDLGSATAFIGHWSAQGATLLGLAAELRLLGVLALRDELKSQAAEVIAQLARQGKTIYLITGDNRLTALTIARQTAIAPANVFAEIRPEQKAGIVRQLQQRGERVAFVGDGINDAPALAQADLGVAVSRASDVAREAADIILLKSDIQAIPEALGLAQATLRVIKQNLFWAFFYNAAAVPLAAMGFLNPVLCALAMGLSDLIVIGNALRLSRWK